MAGTRQHLYVRAPCVADGNIITANPAGFVEFAAAIMKRFGVFPPGIPGLLENTSGRDTWTRMDSARRPGGIRENR
jgi:hypothetical protein